MNFWRFLTISEKISVVTQVVIFCTPARTRAKSRRTVLKASVRFTRHCELPASLSSAAKQEAKALRLSPTVLAGGQPSQPGRVLQIEPVLDTLERLSDTPTTVIKRRKVCGRIQRGIKQGRHHPPVADQSVSPDEWQRNFFSVKVLRRFHWDGLSL
jgi:hypothetical protein